MSHNESYLNIEATRKKGRHGEVWGWWSEKGKSNDGVWWFGAKGKRKKERKWGAFITYMAVFAGHSDPQRYGNQYHTILLYKLYYTVTVRSPRWVLGMPTSSKGSPALSNSQYSNYSNSKKSQTPGESEVPLACQQPLPPSKLARSHLFFRLSVRHPPSHPWFRILVLPPPWYKDPVNCHQFN